LNASDLAEDRPLVVLIGLAPSARLNERLAPLSEVAQVRCSPATSQEAIGEAIADADAVIIRGTALSGAALARARRLKGVAVFGIGVDNIDLKAARRSGIAVANTPVFAQSVAEGTLLLALAAARRYNELDRMVRYGERPDSNFRGAELIDKTLGLIGMGRVATELVRLVSGFNMRVIGCDPFLSADEIRKRGAEPVSMDSVLAGADFVCVLCPLTKDTHHLIGPRELSLMKQSAFLVNTARGPIVDESALIDALEDKTIAGAALDVFEKEPPETDNPLLHMDNVAAWPHRAPATWETYDRVVDATCRAALAFLRNQPPEYPVVGEY